MKVDFVNGYAHGWVMCVPDCFKGSLQNEAFNVGDVFYDNPKSYQLPWREALKHIKVSLQIRSVGAGAVTFDVLVPTDDHSSIRKIETRTSTVQEFMDLLKHGL